MPTISFSQLDFTPIKSQIKNIIVVVGALFLVIYGGNEYFWTPKKKKLNRTINNYLSTTQELDRVKIAPSKYVDDPKSTAVQKIDVKRTDKIIWADKLKAISAAIPENVWVSNLKIAGNSLVISCHVASYGQDHLKTIAAFIKDLKSRNEILKDFGEVRFHSAIRNKDIYNFDLTFPLKRGIIQQITETVSQTTS